MIQPEMKAYQILRKEYGMAKNFMTPTVLKVGRYPWGAWELSEGRGLEPGTMIYGVSVVRVFEDGSTQRLFDTSKMFRNKADAELYIVTLKGLKEAPAG